VKVDSPAYTLAFATLVCVVCALFVSSASVLLKDRQEINRLLYLRKNVLQAAGLTEPGQRLSTEQALTLFNRHIRPRLVDLRSGEYVSGMDVESYQQRAARGDPDSSRPVGDNPAGVRRIPHLAKVYLVEDQGEVKQVVIPVEGLGLYGTLYGFLALERDTRTISGIAFYENRETPGLGGEVDNPRWRALWPGRQAFDNQWQPAIRLVKGQVGGPAENPYEVDALSGATITSNAVTELLRFWLSGQGFGPYLEKARTRGVF
jgi:Na+-transporting NADH:ubiquinone oxidoreductase subunit C